MVLGTSRVVVGAAVAVVAVARQGLAAAPLLGRGVDVADAPVASDDTVTPITPGHDEEPTSPGAADPAPEEPEFDPAAVAAGELATRDDEDPWTEAEVAEVHEELTRRATELRAELAALDEELDGLIRRGGEGTGQDSADVGSATSERDHEISLGNNARTMLAQTERALERLAEGSFGVCEGCGGAIGKMRVMAFPRATLCLSCKQREERR